MISAPPAPAYILCCPGGIWQLVARTEPVAAILTAPARSLQEMAKYVAALEAANHALRLGAQVSAEWAQFRLDEL